MSLQLPNTGIREFVAELAKKHNVEYVETNHSALARQISRLSDAEAAPDETEELVIALRQANVIDGPAMVALLGRYFGELSVAPRQFGRLKGKIRYPDDFDAPLPDDVLDMFEKGENK